MQLLAEIDAMSPDRDRSADGWIGDAAHQARHSDHNPEGDGSVDARDFTHDPAHGADMREISEQIRKDPRVLGDGYVIFDGRITDDQGEWQDYDGSNQHTHHMHVSVNDAGQNDTSRWLTDQGEFTVAEIDRLIKAQEATTAAVKAERLSVIAQGQKTRATFRHQSALTRQAIAEGNGDTVAAKEAETEAKQAKAEADAIDDYA
jgi:hypothetical protein